MIYYFALFCFCKLTKETKECRSVFYSFQSRMLNDSFSHKHSSPIMFVVNLGLAPPPSWGGWNRIQHMMDPNDRNKLTEIEKSVPHIQTDLFYHPRTFRIFRETNSLNLKWSWSIFHHLLITLVWFLGLIKGKSEWNLQQIAKHDWEEKKTLIGILLTPFVTS